MIIKYNPHHGLHHPKFELFDGKLVPHVEIPQRIDYMIVELLMAGYPVKEASDNGISLKELSKVHSLEYIQAVRNQTNEKQYKFDTYTPVGKGTFNTALVAANVTLQLAKELTKGERLAYALVRPPGHHATNSQMGGYCYFNNAAISAEHLSKTGKVAILDLDLHHGNGTQEFFYDRDDVLYVSIHADPKLKFPYTTGFKAEVGVGDGKSFNLNIPLPLGTGTNGYTLALEQALNRIRKFNPEYLIISFGLDTHELDPIGGFRLPTGYYELMGFLISQLDLPTLIVQEGGYNLEVIGKASVNFLNGLTAGITIRG